MALLMVSATLLTLESTTRLLEPLRSFVGTMVSPLRFVAETPYFIGGEVDEVLVVDDNSTDNIHNNARTI